MQQRHSLVAALYNGLSRSAALRVVTRAGAEEKGQAFFRQAHAGGTRADLHQLGFIQNVLACFCNGRAIGANNSHHASRSQFLRGQCGGTRVARVVFHHDLDLTAINAALGIDLVSQQADNVLHVLPFRGPFARKGTHEADFDVSGKSRRRHQQGEGKSPKQTTKCFHKNPPSVMR